MIELPEFLRKMLPPENVMPAPEGSTLAMIEEPGASCSAPVEGSMPTVVEEPGASKKLTSLSHHSLDALADIFKMSVKELADLPRNRLEKLIMAHKLKMAASEIALRTQTRVDENKLRMSAVDTWPKLEERLEKARIEARQLREERLAQDKGGVTGGAPEG